MRTTRRTRAVRFLAAGAALTMAATACSSPDPDPVASGGRVFVGLRSSAPTLLREGQSCDQVLDEFRSFAPTVLGGMYGGVMPDVLMRSGVAAADDSVGGAGLDAAESQSTSAPDAPLAYTGDGDSSTTNTQEEGIDEPDLVETDGEYVYLVDQDQLVILDAATGEVVGRTILAGYGAQILLSGDRLLTITGGYGYGIGGRGFAVDDVATSAAVEGPVEEGGDSAEPSAPDGIVRPDPEPEPLPIDPVPLPVEPPSFAAGTVLQLIDVSDRTAPTTVETTEIEGQHVTTRVVGGVARVVVTSYPQPQPLMDAQNEVFADGTGDVDDLQAAVAEHVADTDITDWLPSFRTTVAGESDPVEGPLVECSDVLVPEVNAGLSETSILRVDFDEGFDPAETTTVVAEAGTVYASAATLYLAATRYVSVPEQGDIAVEDWSTAIHAFDLRGEGPAVHMAAGEVPGSTLNQYSLSEYDGNLRIATTDGTPWGPGGDSESGVHVLHLRGDELVEVGAVRGLGVSETIQSVRFMGPVGYVVTFRQTDPLYVIDLSDPVAPKAVGELKIPGFSSYLHPAGEGRLIGIGRDATDDGQDQGLLVSLFDVSDPTAPTQLRTYTERNGYSNAGNDPKAFLWWAPESALVIPIERYAVGVERPDGYEVGMTVLDVDDGGITARATVTANGSYPSRALVVDGRLWSVFDGAVVISDFADPAGGTLHRLR